MTESTLFTFLPASMVQLAYFCVALIVLYRPNPGIRLVNLDKYLRMVHGAFALHFGLLAVWWTSRRGVDGAAAAVEEPVENLDMNLLQWILGPLEPEAKTSVTPLHSAERSLSPEQEQIQLLRRRR